MVKIQFADRAREAEGFVALAKQGRVVCFSDDTYEIAKAHLKILDDLHISYQVASEDGFDDVCHALRNSLAAQI
ncbi:MAG: hypothetical protein HY360_19980 [Verrucomicrobia bacterium]|nr:hypothetical protein [Verrucomicrobiota bacterium]